ncbi:MAG: hypothetical protein J5749_05255 [Lachnospiraceae bacterium]|nr:hypothetical protein [Lachnospiraceae bacterium]
MKKRLVIIILVLALVLSACSSADKKGENEGQAKAEENTEFDMNNGKTPENENKEEESEPEEEEVIDATKLTEEEYWALREAIINGEEVELPRVFDLRDYGLTTSSKDQGYYGTCWAFGVIGALESTALVMGCGVNDFSEYHIAYLSENIPVKQDEMIDGEGFKCDDNWIDVPGTAEFEYGPLMKGYGPALESEYPYGNVMKPLDEDAINHSVFKIDSCYMISMADTETLKKRVIENGSVTIGIDAEEWGGWGGYHYNARGTLIDHYVTIVGWDDTVDRNLFDHRAEKNGAWIIKNSWGSMWAEQGHCYLSYEDHSFFDANPATSFTLAPNDVYDYQYQYDGGFGALKIKDVTNVAIHFTTKENQTITGIKAYPLFDDDHCNFEPLNATVKVYKNLKSIDNIDNASPIYSMETAIVYPGYQTLEFTEGVNINKGDEIYVSVTFDRKVRYAYDGPTKGKRTDQWGEMFRYSVKTHANPNETFFRITGENAWKDCITEREDSNLCIKVMVRNGHNKEVIHRFERHNQ